MPVASGATSVMLNSPWQSSAVDSPPKMKSSSPMMLRSGATNRMWPRIRVPSGSVMGAPLLTVTVSTPSGIATAELLQVLLLGVVLDAGVQGTHQLLTEGGRHESSDDSGHGGHTCEPASRLRTADLVDDQRGDEGDGHDRLDDRSDGDLVLVAESHAASYATTSKPYLAPSFLRLVMPGMPSASEPV